jgi:acetate kinase
MERLSDIAPAHNPPYVKAMRQLQAAFPQMPLVAALETAFHETIPLAHRCYAIPDEWRTQYSIQRWGFHGASHRYISTRMAQLLGKDDLKIVSCHLGGSNSLCAINAGKSIATTMGMSPQGGLPNNNRVGDFDAFALPILLRETGKPLAQILDELSSKGGLLGLSGLSGDARDLEEAELQGNEKAKLAMDVFVASIKLYLGGYMAYLEGADAVVFTAGIGENSVRVRRDVCAGFEWAGLKLDQALNAQSSKIERKISTSDSKVQVWVVPTNEEIVVARQTAEAIQNK